MAIPIWTIYSVCSVYVVYVMRVVTDGLIVLGDVQTIEHMKRLLLQNCGDIINIRLDV